MMERSPRAPVLRSIALRAMGAESRGFVCVRSRPLQDLRLELAQ
jgi:hypothetical protein